ncbi:DUF167 domain-containing protein [Thermosulfuriphilus sp.]
MDEAVLPHPEGVIIKVHVQPRAKKTELAGRHGQAIKVRLAAPPVEGKANKALLSFMAQRLSLPLTALTIISGHKGRDKRILIQGVNPEEIKMALVRLNKW